MEKEADDGNMARAAALDPRNFEDDESFSIESNL